MKRVYYQYLIAKILNFYRTEWLTCRGIASPRTAGSRRPCTSSRTGSRRWSRRRGPRRRRWSRRWRGSPPSRWGDPRPSGPPARRPLRDLQRRRGAMEELPIHRGTAEEVEWLEAGFNKKNIVYIVVESLLSREKNINNSIYGRNIINQNKILSVWLCQVQIYHLPKKD